MLSDEFYFMNKNVESAYSQMCAFGEVRYYQKEFTDSYYRTEAPLQIEPNPMIVALQETFMLLQTALAEVPSTEFTNMKLFHAMKTVSMSNIYYNNNMIRKGNTVF